MNKDIKEIMTNTSAEKSINSSFKHEPVDETRIKESQKPKAMDLISEYRQTIMERYAERVLGPSQSSQIHDSASKGSEIHKSAYSKKTLPATRNKNIVASALKNGNSQLKSESHRRRYKSMYSLLTSLGCKKEKERTFIDKSANRPLHRAKRNSLDTSIEVGLRNHNEYGGKKTKTTLRKQVENASHGLTMGEFIKFYKTRRPNGEDLNTAH